MCWDMRWYMLRWCVCVCACVCSTENRKYIWARRLLWLSSRQWMLPTLWQPDDELHDSASQSLLSFCSFKSHSLGTRKTVQLLRYFKSIADLNMYIIACWCVCVIMMHKCEVCVKDYACMCTVSQITNVILVLSSVERMCVYISCVCEHVCVFHCVSYY